MSHRLQSREAEHGRTEKIEKYKDLPSPFKDFQGLFYLPESNTAGSEVVPVVVADSARALILNQNAQ